MGYSCTVKADLTLDGIRKLVCNEIQNEFEIDGEKYFSEIGRENDDGAITGTIWNIIKEGAWKGRCKKAGSFRIEPDGKIKRFPFISKENKKIAEGYGREEYLKNYII